jgi:cysteinyl-tRNA synthetase
MSWKHLGQTFDIHAGGIDLIFPHHENEVAQSRCCFGTDVMAHVWLHNGFLQVEGEKMSKSLGNFITIRDVLKDWPGEVVRLAMLRTHYRQPIDWTLRGLEESRRTLDGWFKSIGGTEISQRFGAPSEEVIGKLYDDLNFPAAFAAMSSLAKSAKEDNVSAISLSRTLHFFGFDQGIDRIARAMKKEIEVSDEQTKYAGDVRWGSISNLREKGFDFTKLNNLIDRRNNARLTKNWAESDQIRTEIKTLGIVLKDSKDGTTTWTVE